MKLQNLSVIFIVIIIPIILIVSYYISLQVDTINMQTAYNTKLLESTKEAIEAFEINTVEWNDAYSETADSKRRDIMASINTFTTSFSNSIGMGGASKETVLSYVPAIAFTLYDGYYIYSPAETKEVIKDDNGVAVFMSRELANEIGYTSYNEENHKGKILYVAKNNSQGTYTNADGETKQFTLNPGDAETTYSHILKPFTAYSARYKKGSDTDITVNYTLDNYITIYGNVNENYEKKSGYLIDTDTAKITMPVETINGIKLNGNININPETLSEKIAWKWTKDGATTVAVYDYVYEAENNTKVYFEGNTPFQVSSTGIRTNLDQLSSVKYKKLSIYKKPYTCIEIYQALVTKGDIEQGKWYKNTTSKDEVTSNYGQPSLKNDTSAVNYYVESYAFSEWVYDKLGSITVGDMQGETGEITITGTIFDDIEKEDSVFNLHKREVIKQAVISNLNQAITSYSRNSEGEFSLPVLTETDWDQILDNISIITFVQGIPIGMKYYNNYAIATSTSNKEYVDPDEIYLNAGDVSADSYYHLPYCKEIDSSLDLKGYRSIDYRIKSYKDGDEVKYYYRHDNISKEECYYCLVQRSLYEKDIDDEKKAAYETALAREKYAARTTSIPNPVTADLGGAPGGDTPGGDTPGGDTPGGDIPGGDTPGGDIPGGDTPELPNPGDVIVEELNDGDEDITDEIYIPQDGYYEIILVAGGGGGIEGDWILEEWWYLYGGGSGAGFKRNCIFVQRKL